VKLSPSVAVTLVSLALAATTLQPARDEIRDLQWHLDALRIPEAQAIAKGAGVTVGVIATGVDATHPDLSGNVLPGFDSTPTPTGQGQIDIDGHGTAMAGLIAAHGRATGIAPDAKILPVRSQEFVVTFVNDASDEINWAVDHGANVLCLAFTESGPSSQREADAVARAIQRDVVVVAGIGNTNTPASGVFPAAYPGVVAAAGTDQAGNHAAISVTGPQAVLSAPAVEITSTAPLSRAVSGYVKGDGTSNSTAIIAGVAALVRSKYPNLSATEVIHRMTATADDKGPPGRDNEYGYGIVNPVKALTADVPPLTPSAESTIATSPPPDSGGSTSTLVIIGAVVLALLLGTGLVVMLRRRTAA
jgi:type VII secretion-associated serine protease mycosin